MNKLFDLNDLKTDIMNSYKHSQVLEKSYYLRIENLKNLLGRLPRENEAFFIETKKSFSAFTFIVYLMKHSGVIRELYIATYSTNERIIRSLVHWHGQGKIEHVHLFIAEKIKNRMPAVYEKLLQLQQEGIIELQFAWSHKKVTAVRTDEGCYVVEGSGNYGENSMIENYIFVKSRELYEFRTRNSCK